LLPIVLGFLFALANRALPQTYRLKGLYAYAVAAIMFVTAGFGVCAGFAGAI